MDELSFIHAVVIDQCRIRESGKLPFGLSQVQSNDHFFCIRGLDVVITYVFNVPLKCIIFQHKIYTLETCFGFLSPKDATENIMVQLPKASLVIGMHIVCRLLEDIISVDFIIFVIIFLEILQELATGFLPTNIFQNYYFKDFCTEYLKSAVYCQKLSQTF